MISFEEGREKLISFHGKGRGEHKREFFQVTPASYDVAEFDND
jgi:hypothetical protein